MFSLQNASLDFPVQLAKSTVLNNVKKSMKSEKKIYQLIRTSFYCVYADIKGGNVFFKIFHIIYYR